MGPYLVHVFRRAAVNVTTGATLSKDAGCNIAQCQKSIAVILTNDSLVTRAFSALAVGVGASNGARDESEDGKVQLHYERRIEW